MLKFVIFVCFLAVQTVRADECAKGPEYWCSSLDNAVECGSFKHCLDTVWTKHARFLSRPLGLEGETLNPNKCQNCVLCLQSNIEKCPMARKHSKQVHEMVARDIPRRTICELLNHCDKPQEDSDETKAKEFFSNIKIKFFETAQTVVETPLSPKSLKETNGMACELCNIVFTAAKYLIQNKVEQEKVFGFIEEQLCARLGAYNSTCVDLIEKEGAELLEIISNSYNAAEACRKLGLCSKNQIGTAERPVELLNLSVEKNNANCTLCKLTMLQVKHMLLNGKSQKEILDYFNSNLCARIGKSKDLCTTFIDQYGPVLLELIGKDINPDQLCVMLGFCAKATSQVVRVHLQKDVQMPKVEGDTTCVICEFAMNLLVKYVNQNTSAPEVEKWLEYICNTEMPKPIRNECSAFVAQYGPIIISLLIKQVDPKKICETIGACPKTQTVLTSFDASIVQPNSNDVKDMPVAKVPTPKKEITCSLCKLVMQYVDEKMEVDRTTQLLQLTVDNMCNMVPKRLRSECESLVDKYGVKLLNFIKQNTDPELVCAHIKVCEAQEAEVAWANIKPSKDMKFTGQDDIKINSIHEHVSAKNGSLECSLCLYVAELVDSLLKQNKTDQEIVAELKQVCKLFPSSLKDQCDAFINEYGVYVIQVLAADLDPQATCTLLKLCDSSIIGFTPRKTRYPF